jgi:hypothetical protein
MMHDLSNMSSLVYSRDPIITHAVLIICMKLSDDTTGYGEGTHAICRLTTLSGILSRLAPQAEPSKLARVKRLSTERDHPISARPLARVSIPGQFDPVEIRIVQVDGLMCAVIGCPIDRGIRDRANI